MPRRVGWRSTSWRPHRYSAVCRMLVEVWHFLCLPFSPLPQPRCGKRRVAGWASGLLGLLVHTLAPGAHFLSTPGCSLTCARIIDCCFLPLPRTVFCFVQPPRPYFCCVDLSVGKSVWRPDTVFPGPNACMLTPTYQGWQPRRTAWPGKRRGRCSRVDRRGPSTRWGRAGGGS